VDDIALNIIRGDKEVKRAVEIRKKSRKKLWIITGLIVLILIVVAIILYFQFFRRN
jgi:t-SNARE complex subunit (syntaxin)